MVDVTTPPEAVSIFVPGAEKLGVLVRLNASARNCSRHAFVDLELLEQREDPGF